MCSVLSREPFIPLVDDNYPQGASRVLSNQVNNIEKVIILGIQDF